MAVGERDPPDRCGTLALSRGDDRLRATARCRVNQRKPVVLANQIGVDEPQTG
jgi:hypothetical protein